jgi:hypothetical protein
MAWKLIGAALALLPATASAENGPVVVWFQDEPQAVSDKLAILCADKNASVIEQDDRHVLCQREVSGGKGILAQAMLGNSSSTSPQLMIRFAVLRDRKSVRVQASQWVEIQMAGGQTRRTDLNSSKQRSELENTLIAAGAHNAPADILDQQTPSATDSTTGK